MAIVPLPLSPSAEARALLHDLLEHGDIVGRDTAGRTIIQLAVETGFSRSSRRSTPTQPSSRTALTLRRTPTSRRMGRR
jgi:hypothetical protein